MLVLAIWLLTCWVALSLLRTASKINQPAPMNNKNNALNEIVRMILRQSRGFLGVGGKVGPTGGVATGGVAGGNGAGAGACGVTATGVAASGGATGWEGACGVDRATSANKGVGACAAGCVGTPPFAYGTPGFRKLLFSTVFFYVLACSHPNETVSEYNHITVMAIGASGKASRRANI